MDNALRELLKGNGMVQTLEADPVRYPMQVNTAQAPQLPIPGQEVIPYGITHVDTPALPYNHGVNRTICLIDSGYDLHNDDLPSGGVSGAFDMQGSGDWYVDETGHGTHVAGTIAALANGKGVVGLIPRPLDVNLFIVKVFGKDPNSGESTWTSSSNLIAALDRCEDAGATIVNMSLGGPEKAWAERRAFARAAQRGMLLVAAAGNDGPDAPPSYPAFYPSVISVGAVDANNELASFSQHDREVELVAPGVDVLSTVPADSGRLALLAAKGIGQLAADPLEGSALGEVSGTFLSCGLAQSICPAQGQICLIQRGENTFADKVPHCQEGGGIGAVIVNNEPGSFAGTLGDQPGTIPVVGLPQEAGPILAALPSGQAITLTVAASSYGLKSGTSMATPHVVGVAALVWSYHPDCSAQALRQALDLSALDLGSPGRDPLFGFGLVQAQAAKVFLDRKSCGRPSLPALPLP
jgi:subtilisin family serine protease